MSKTSVCCFAVIAIFSLLFVEQASAIRCYACKSDSQPECISNANQPKFVVDCSSYVRNSNSSMFGFYNHDAIEAKAVVEYDCASGRGISTNDGRTIVERGCALKPLTCETYKIVYAVGDGKRNGFQVDNCKRCSTNLCNAL